jgi:hypothetical protein
MQPKLLVTEEMAASYLEVFVNRRAYTVQSPRPHEESGKHYYYRPRGAVALSTATIRHHLEGELTIGLYAINPQTQSCKWVAIDADYSSALDDLLKLQWELRQDGLEAALEKSRRGGHLWLFAGQPLLARDCRLYIYNLAHRLRVPVKGQGLGEGIEVFPKQDMVPAKEFGNAIRGPLGIHRATGRRYWFYGADYTLEAQIGYLSRLKRITENEMATIVAGLKMPEEFISRRSALLPPPDPTRREFRILDHVTVKRRHGRNYWTRCPSCAGLGRDRTGDNLAIAIADPRKYRCWAGCSKEMIRSALGCPIRRRIAN